VLYGARWAAADPLLVSGTIVGLCGMLLAMTRVLLLTSERLAESTRLNWVVAVSAALPVALTGWLATPADYLWGLAVAQGLAAAYGLSQLRPLLAISLWPVFVPALAATALAAAAFWLAWPALQPFPLPAQLAGGAVIYALAFTLTLRLIFPERVRALLGMVPRGHVGLRWLRLA
jgi:hypothetical protein